MTNCEDGMLPTSSESNGPLPIRSTNGELSGTNYLNRRKSLCGGGDEVQDQFPLIRPFAPIAGESDIHLAHTSEGILVITNYRLFVHAKPTNFNVPLGLIDQVEGRDMCFLHVGCKDARSFKCSFGSNEVLSEVLRKLQQTIASPTTASPRNIDDSFAIIFFEKSQDLSDDLKLQLGSDPETVASEPYLSYKERFDAEIKRMEFNTTMAWRVSEENKEYSLCSSYPPNIIVPMSIGQKKLEQVAGFRSARRFPAVVWRHRGNGAVICRCSQPEVGWFGWRSCEDEELVQNIIEACKFDNSNNVRESHTIALDSALSLGSISNGNPGGSIEFVNEPTNVKKLLLLDARSYTTAMANRTRGGGVECVDYYPHCEIQFMNLANIHSIRKSFINVRQLCAQPADQANWYSQLESSKWLQHMSGLIKAAVTVVNGIETDGRPVMVHCSDGWDRTPQIVALAEILLDPYYRSLKGFQILVEREWLDFGHKFGDRCGQGVGSDDSNERCPVFLQWLDCLHQLVLQFPLAFEFNLTFLVKLAQHTYSNLFGTFLCNTAKEREFLETAKKTHSVWRFLRASANFDKFRNSMYANSDRVLVPKCEVRDLMLWSQVYLGYENPQPVLTKNPESSPTPSVAADGETDRFANCKTSRSCDDLTNLNSSKGLQRKMSDSSLRESFHGTDDLDMSQSKENLLQSAAAEEEVKLNSSSETVTFHIGSENEDDAEPNSEGRSECTVINTHRSRINVKSIESSTDTLVCESGVTEPKSPVHETKTENHNNSEDETPRSVETPVHTIGQFDNPSPFNDFNPDYLYDGQSYYHPEDNTQGLNDDLAQLANLNLQLQTATSPQNNCEVCASSKKLVERLEALEDVNLLINGYGSTSTGITSSTSTSSSGIGPSNTGSKYSSDNTPIHSRTPSTGIPATPCNEEVGGKQGDPTCLVGTGNDSPYEVDGLTSLHCEVQSEYRRTVNSLRMQVETLQKDLQNTRMALMKQVGHKCTNHIADHPDDTDTVSLSDSQCSGEHRSVGQESNASEISWEAVDEKDTRPPLWVPDYAVNQCRGCSSTFWVGKRKHHCRLCGDIFCANCSDHNMQIPAEQIFKPVRVCRSCFQKSQTSLDLPSTVDQVSSVDSSSVGPTPTPTSTSTTDLTKTTTSSVPSLVDLSSAAGAHSQQPSVAPHFRNLPAQTHCVGTHSKTAPEKPHKVLLNGTNGHRPVL